MNKYYQLLRPYNAKELKELLENQHSWRNMALLTEAKVFDNHRVVEKLDRRYRYAERIYFNYLKKYT